MTSILDQVHVLEGLARGRGLVAFDYDGTLAPIVDDPAAARMSTTTRGLLEQVAESYPCVVISGRAQDDIMRRVRGIHLREVIGNHGLEPSRYSRTLRDEVGGWRVRLAEALADVPEVWLEDKIFSLAVHYRRAIDPDAALARILAAAAPLAGARLLHGKLVLNIVSERAPDKGRALLAVQHRLGCEQALYVGDDQTDEDVFALPAEEHVIGVRVGDAPDTKAQYLLGGQEDVDPLLALLLSVRLPTPRA